MTIQTHTVLQKLCLGNYSTGQFRYFDNNLSRTSKKADLFYELYIDKAIRRVHQFIDQTIC